MIELIQGIDLITLGVAAFFFAIFLIVFFNVVYHTYHGNIKEVFVMAIIAFVLAGVVLLLLGFDVFNLM